MKARALAMCQLHRTPSTACNRLPLLPSSCLASLPPSVRPPSVPLSVPPRPSSPPRAPVRWNQGSSVWTNRLRQQAESTCARDRASVRAAQQQSSNNSSGGGDDSVVTAEVVTPMQLGRAAWEESAFLVTLAVGDANAPHELWKFLQRFHPETCSVLGDDRTPAERQHMRSSEEEEEDLDVQDDGVVNSRAPPACLAAARGALVQDALSAAPPQWMEMNVAQAGAGREEYGGEVALVRGWRCHDFCLV
jgi:hypothetical protein